MKTKITKTEAKRLMRQIVASKGENYVFPSHKGCFYFYGNGRPACIVGHLVYALGVRRKDMFFENEYQDVCTLNTDTGVLDLLNRLFPNTDELVIEALQAAQSVQDHRYPWSAALEAFERVMKGELRMDVEDDLMSVPQVPA